MKRHQLLHDWTCRGVLNQPNRVPFTRLSGTGLEKRLKGRVTPHRKYGGNGHVPIARRPEPAGAPAARSRLSNQDESSTLRLFIDETITATGISALRVAKFREDLRPQITDRMPEQLTTVEFLQRANLLGDGRLTRAGALLFGEDPTAVVPIAVVHALRRTV